MPYANANGIRLYYEAHGQGDPLVLIAGMGADHRSWFPQIREFERHYRVITFDNRGIGRTERTQGLYGFETLAADVIGLLDHLSLESAHMLGESLGGIVAQETAIGFPQRVRRLILANTSVGRGSEIEVDPVVKRTYGLQEGSTDVDIGKLMRTHISLSFNSRIYKAVMTVLATLYVRPSGFSGMAEQLKAISAHSTLDRLHLIKSPTLVITGTRDRLVPPVNSDVLAGQIPGAKLVKVEGGPHALHVEMKDRFNREVLDFLAAV